MSQPRQLAPIFDTLPDAIEGMRAAVAAGSFFQYRLSADDKRKHQAIDLFTCSIAVQVWDKISQKSRDRSIQLFKNNPGRFAMAALRVANKVQ